MHTLLYIIPAVVAFVVYVTIKVKTADSSIDNVWTYFPYAIKRFGLIDGLRRVWKFHVSPVCIYRELTWKYRAWKLVDRRKKKNWTRTLYAVNRDGDPYIVECPSCNDMQGLWMHRPSDLTPPGSTEWVQEAPCDVCNNQVMKSHFHCSRCGIGINVYLEDGLYKIRDHRDGNTPTPAQLVQDDNGVWHAGITADAPWWWKRREAYRDYNPDNGKDGHGHHKYTTFPNPNQPSPQECMPESPVARQQKIV